MTISEGDGAPAPGAITALLQAAGNGDRAAVDQVFGLVYRDLRQIARRQRRGGSSDTLDTTALVHESYLKLSRNSRWSIVDRSHFFALAARAMRQILIDHARHHARDRRGGGVRALSLDETVIAVEERASELIALDAALVKLEALDEPLARLVEWRFFAGLSLEEIANLTSLSTRTLKRHWQSARAFLYQEINS